jgi:parvulin-like peptidyl-prolyl isomerase
VVNDEIVDDSVLREERRSLQATHGAELSQEEIGRLARRTLALRILLRQKAASDPEPLPASTDPQNALTGCRPAAREEIELTLRIERLLARASAHVERPNRKEIDTFYKLNRSRFVMPETIWASHIIKNVTETFSRDEALLQINRAKEALESGAEFSKVAEQFSDCPANAGDLGWFARGVMVEEFDDRVFSLAEGEISDVFETRFGFHIARLTGRRAAGIQPLSLLRETIAGELLERRKRRALDHYFDTLLSESHIEWRPAAS